MHKRLAALLALTMMVVLLVAGGQAVGQVGDAVLVGAGDIASCKSTGDEATADLIDGIAGTVAAFGDNAYENGSLSEYNDCYDPSSSWGGFKERTKPSVGNHEYQTPGASGYWDYFGAAAGERGKGYYSYDLGSWHVVVLNSNCAEVSCAAGSQQERWLRDDLAAHPTACTAAYFHHPRFASSGVGSNSAVAPFWEALYDADAEVVLNGHAHNYERFAPQTPGGQKDLQRGIREFVVGTGGKSLNSFSTTIRANSEKRLNNAYGVIKLTLHPDSYDWEFVTAPGGAVADSGSDQCHGTSTPPPTDTTAPTVTSTVPASNATGVDPAADVMATFSEDMQALTINGQTFKLFVKGTTTKISNSISYNASTDTATLDPTNSLQTGTTYKAVVTTKAEDLAGNQLDQKDTQTGPQNKTWSFTVRN